MRYYKLKGERLKEKERDRLRAKNPESCFQGDLNVIDSNVKSRSRRDQSKAEGLYINGEKIDFCRCFAYFYDGCNSLSRGKDPSVGRPRWQLGQGSNRDFNFSSS